MGSNFSSYARECNGLSHGVSVTRRAERGLEIERMDAQALSWHVLNLLHRKRLYHATLQTDLLRSTACESKHNGYGCTLVSKLVIYTTDLFSRFDRIFCLRVAPITFLAA